MKEIIPCDIRMDEGLRFRTDNDVIPCIVSHIHKDGGGTVLKFNNGERNKI